MLTKPGDKIKLTLSLPSGFGDSTHDAVVTRVLKNGRVYASLGWRRSRAGSRLGAGTPAGPAKAGARNANRGNLSRSRRRRSA